MTTTGSENRTPDKIKNSLPVPKGQKKSGTAEFSKKGAPADLDWKNPNKGKFGIGKMAK